MRTDDLKTRQIYVKFDIGDIVYHKLAKEKHPGMVTGIVVRPSGNFFYVSWPDNTETAHFDLELTREFIPDYSSDNAEDD